MVFTEGYSWFANEHGLAIDSVLRFEIVLPNGTVTTASNTMNKGLFFVLEGGQNNFGIVTKITLSTFPLGQVWGGPAFYFGSNLTSAVVDATVNFAATNTDKKAQIVTSLNVANLFGKQFVQTTVLLFYNGPTPPADVFKEFTSISGAQLNNVKTRSLMDLGRSVLANLVKGKRVAFNTISVCNVSADVVTQSANQAAYLGPAAVKDNKSPFLITVAVEPFLPTYLDNSKGAAYPHDPSLTLYPIFLFFFWDDGKAEADSFYLDGIKQAARAISDTAIKEGQNDVNKILYPNYAFPGTSLDSLFGSKLSKLKETKKKYDPKNVMGLAGGSKL